MSFHPLAVHYILDCISLSDYFLVVVHLLLYSLLCMRYPIFCLPIPLFCTCPLRCENMKKHDSLGFLPCLHILFLHSHYSIGSSLVFQVAFLLSARDILSFFLFLLSSLYIVCFTWNFCSSTSAVIIGYGGGVIFYVFQADCSNITLLLEL